MHRHPPSMPTDENGKVEGCPKCIADAIDQHLLFAIQKGGAAYMKGARQTLGGELTTVVPTEQVEAMEKAWSTIGREEAGHGRVESETNGSKG